MTIEYEVGRSVVDQVSIGKVMRNFLVRFLR